jgi:CDP-6-deoxy-D-xylo-4-hexulose-3-dehydrase
MCEIGPLRNRDLVENDPLIQDRQKILDAVHDYATKSLAVKEFIPGQSPVPVSGKVLTAPDLVALVDASLDGWLTAGRFTEDFQRKLAKYVGALECVLVNSGFVKNRVDNIENLLTWKIS